MAKLPTNLEVIHKEVFEDCKKLKQVVLPNGLKIIEKKAFIRCEALDEVDLREGLLFIGEDAFWGCKNLTTITIPASLKKMETGVFARCSKLKNFRVMEDNAFYTANCGLITGKLSGNLLFCLPAKEGECVLPEQITGIHSLAFSGCDDITRIVFPSGIRYFAKNAFVNFGAHLETVEISDVTTWLNIVVESRAHIHPLLYHYPNPFVNHAQMAINGQIVYDLIIPDGIKSIRDEAFKGCGSITSVYIPDSVIHLGNSCFDDCPNLKLVSISGEITGLMPHSLDFTNTDNKLTMRIRNHLGPELSKYISRRKELAIITDFQDIDFELLPSNARFSMTNRIAERLNNGESLSENLRNSYLSYLAKNKKYWISEPKESLVPAFQWMLREKILDIKEVNDLLKKISDFKEPLLMSALLEYSQGLSAEERGEHEQIDLDDIEMDILPANKLSETAYLRSHWMVSRGAGIVKKMKKTTENVVFPSKLGVKVLTEISDDFAFLDEEGRDARTQVKTITIPAGYERIGRNAFQGCTNLKEVVIENGLKHIGPCAFAKCKNLKKITIPGSVKTIDYGAFSSCTILEEVVVQEGVEVIDEDVFFMCNALKVIDIPSSVKIIMWRAFTKSGIEAVLVQGKNTLIQWPYAFEECRNYWIYAVPGFNADGLVPEIIIKPLEEYDKLCKQDDIVRPLNGKSFAVSGELKVLRDRDVEVLEETIEQLGGKLKDEVTETTTALITNYPASGTDLILTAKEYSIPIISETRFLNMIKMKRIKKRNTGDLY